MKNVERNNSCIKNASCITLQANNTTITIQVYKHLLCT